MKLNSTQLVDSGEVRNLTSGIYFYQLRATPNGGQAGKYVETKKMVLLK